MKSYTSEMMRFLKLKCETRTEREQEESIRVKKRSIKTGRRAARKQNDDVQPVKSHVKHSGYGNLLYLIYVGIYRHLVPPRAKYVF